jgi:DNA-binding GntR family transcriptional regulator
MARRAAQIKLSAIEQDTPMHARIYEELRKALMAGVMQPGQVLSYRSLAEALGTSPMPVRDAVRRLITERALEAQPNRTIMVPLLTPERVEEIYKIRISLEGLAAEEAARHVTDKDVAELQALENEMEAAQRSGAVRKYVDANWRFHFKVYGLAGLPQLIDLIESLWLQIGPMINTQLAPFDHHNAAIEALARRDGAAAREAMARDLGESRQTLLTRMRAEAEAPAAAPPKRPAARR